ncbi:aldehyde dehydrogenase family protein [Sinimarinibacterium thermocellulolyticum]|uniref:Aldehyde dehydrogenase n=1 Tax=Sinimarinibacterium thermocellulolyticum TaxID=3170016 RepID=A0ABV2AFB7_9GAMM
MSLAVRRDRLDRGLAMILDCRRSLLDALRNDFPARGEAWTTLAEILVPINAFQHARKHLHQWMRAERRRAPMPFSLFGARAEIQYQPLGVIGIMGAWNGAVALVLTPLAPALAAGNRAMLCPSDMMPATAEVLARAVAKYFDPRELAVARGGLDVSRAFSSLPFDHLLFTGSSRVGALVMQAAAANLTPVTLELGGKCPVVIGPDADLDDAAGAVVAAKTLNGGQACLAPDLLLVPCGRRAAFIEAMSRAMAKLYPGGARNPDYCGLINARQFERVDSLLEEARRLGASVTALGVGADPDDQRRASERRLALHVVADAPASSRVMTEEIFGPVMVIVDYDKVDAACAYLRKRPKPLGLYVFSRDRRWVQTVLDLSFSGGVTVNDAMFHYSVPDLPFGGVGHSGMGAYSVGIHGFRQFSHARAVYRQAGPRAILRILQPPYGRLFDLTVRRHIEHLAAKHLPR